MVRGADEEFLTSWFDMNGGKGTKPSDELKKWAKMRLEQLDGWLANREFIAAAEFTVADILMTHVISGGTDQSLVKPHANLLAYQKRCTDRPMWKKAIDAYRDRVEAA